MALCVKTHYSWAAAPCSPFAHQWPGWDKLSLLLLPASARGARQHLSSLCTSFLPQLANSRAITCTLLVITNARPCVPADTNTYINVLSQSRLFYLKISTIDCQAVRFSLFCIHTVGSRKWPRTRSVDCRPLVGGAKTELSNNARYQALYASVAAGRRQGRWWLGTLWTFQRLKEFGMKKRRQGGKGSVLGAPPSGWAIMYPLIGATVYWMAAVPVLLGISSQEF